MKRISAAQYEKGIVSLENFMSMLRDALKEAMEGVELRNESAFAWWGYQIEEYPGLKESQYYCLIYLSAPNILAFHEYYEMLPHPFEANLDLTVQGFFSVSYEQQKDILVNFMKEASSEAIKWNSSQKRQQIVPERFW